MSRLIQILLLSLNLHFQVNVVAQETAAPKFAHFSDFNYNLHTLQEELKLTDRQFRQFDELRKEYLSKSEKLEMMNRDEYDEDLQALSRAERYRLQEHRIDERYANDFYANILSNDDQRLEASRFVLRWNFRYGHFSEFLRRSAVKSNLKITEELYIRSRKFGKGDASSKNRAAQTEELDRKLRLEVLSVLPKSEQKKFTSYLPESEIGDGPKNSKSLLTNQTFWIDIHRTLMLKEVDVVEALDLTEMQRIILLGLIKKYSPKYSMEYHKQWKERQQNQHRPADDKLEAALKIVADVQLKIGGMAAAEIEHLLVPFQRGKFTHLLLRSHLTGRNFYISVKELRILNLFGVDESHQEALTKACKKAFEKRTEALRVIEVETQLDIATNLPREQQQLFHAYFGKYFQEESSKLLFEK